MRRDAACPTSTWNTRDGRPLPPSTHRFKYRLAYVVAGECVVLYDNERGKGDHRHFAGDQEPYKFISPDQLIEDFSADATPELLWEVLTAKRWELLKAMTGAGSMSIRKASRRVGRDVKAVHGDVTALLSAGVLHQTVSGAIEFPFESVRVEFMLRAA